MLTALLNAPVRTQRIAALVITGIVGLIVLGLVQMLGVGLYSAYAEIGEKRAMLGRLQAVAAAEAAFKTPLLPENQADPMLLSGDNEAVMTAALQTWLQEVVGAAGGQINAVSNVSDAGENDIRMIGLRANLSGTMEVIHGTISAIESNQPRLFIKEVSVHSDQQQVSETNSAAQLTATIVFLGAASAQRKP